MGENQVRLDRDTHTYYINDVPLSLCVTDVLDLAGLIKPYPPAAMPYVEAARDLGQALHEWAEWMDTADPAIDPAAFDVLGGTELLPLVLAFQKFRLEHRPRWDSIEEPFYRQGVGGTPDRIGTMEMFDGTFATVILDIKTPKQSQAHWQLQLSAYSWLVPFLECQLFALWLHQDASFELLPYEPAVDVWEGALKVAEWKLRHG